MRPSSYTIILWTKLEVLALFQSAQHVRNMFSYKSVNGTNNARPKDSKENGNSPSTPPPPPPPPQKKKTTKNKKKKKKKKKNDFYPKMKFFHNTGKILCLMKTILCHTQSHANSTVIRVKDTQEMARKRDQPFERLKCLESSP